MFAVIDLSTKMIISMATDVSTLDTCFRLPNVKLVFMGRDIKQVINSK